MTERLIIDLAACDACTAECNDPAVLALRERATFELVCRRCEVPSCVLACPFEALERTEVGMIKRHNLRCVSCKSCALACPFGTIYMELLPFYALDYQAAVSAFVGATSVAKHSGAPAYGSRLTSLLRGGCEAFEIGAVDPADPGVHIIDDFLAVRARRWRRDDREVAA